jgi:signal transduction histidine kinase
MVLGTALRDSRRSTRVTLTTSSPFALAHHLPVRHAQLTLRGAPGIAGEWIIDAMPQFARVGGGFRGYLARASRPVQQDTARTSLAEDRADRLRQLLHELRTPINAIQGYAEFIQQQMVGPAPTRTGRSPPASAATVRGSCRASTISSGCRVWKAGATSDEERGSSELHDTLAATVRQLRPALQGRGASFDLLIRAPDAPVPLSRGDAELLFWRILASVAAGTGEGETVEINLRARRQAVELTVALPRTLQASKDLFATDFRLASDTITPGIFGAGFALRLARAEAQAAGGSLQRDGDMLMLVLPVAENAKRSDGGAAVAG